MACGEGWPSCWTAKVWREKRKDYIWLICKDGKLGCDVCREVSSLGVHKSKNVHLSQEWQSIGIVPSGSTKEKQLTSLRNKIKKHKDHVQKLADTDA